LQPQVVGVQAHEALAAPLDLAGEAITENCNAERVLPHAGQDTASTRLSTSFSNGRRQSSQMYSKIGMESFHRGGRRGKNQKRNIREPVLSFSDFASSASSAV